jgi:hypothetical protein
MKVFIGLSVTEARKLIMVSIMGLADHLSQRSSPGPGYSKLQNLRYRVVKLLISFSYSIQNYV